MRRIEVEGRRPRAGVRRALLVACSAAALAGGMVPAAQAQDAAQPAPAPSPAPAPPEQPEANERRIVVIGTRTIVAALADVEPEQVYDEDAIDSYAVSTLDELLGEIREDNGDNDPTILVNGQPVSDLGDIADLPVEAIARIEALPRGSAQRVGGPAGQRAYNVVLQDSVKSLTVTGSYEGATEGGWDNVRGEAIATYISGDDRATLTFRGAESSKLFESERDDFIPRTERFPYSAVGNVIPFTGTQVDPALSALAGQTVTVVALPAGNAHPTLAALVPGANHTNPSLQSANRTLRGANRPYELALAGNKKLTEELSLSFNGRLNWIDTESSSGLPAARFQIPASNSNTPFSSPVYLALNDPSRPLANTSDNNNVSVSATLNGNFGTWHTSILARYDERKRTTLSDFVPTSTLTVDAATNPFGGTLAPLIQVSTRESRSDSSTTQLEAKADGPLFDAWAGPLLVRAGAAAGWVNYDAEDSSGARTFERHEYLATVGATLPLTSRESAFLPSLGDSEISVDFGWLDLGQFGTLDRYALAFNWQPVPWLRVAASEVGDERTIAPELLAAPDVITPNVPYFDPLTGQTVDVTTIYGGAGNLQSEELRTRTLSVSASPLRKYNLQLNADYLVTDLTNQIGALPPPSTAVVAAFPARFVRDSSGTLILVDNRSVNFAGQHNRQLRLGASFTIPLTDTITVPATETTPRRRIPAWKLQANLSHTWLLESTTVIQPGLPAVDLLEGGAIGISGGQQRHQWSGHVAVTQGPTGFRIEARRRGESFLVIGTLGSPDLLTFEPITTFDLKVFADVGQWFPNVRLARGTRISVEFENIFNERQLVTNSAGVIPQAYQPIYRDPIGRTVMFEIRKVF